MNKYFFVTGLVKGKTHTRRILARNPLEAIIMSQFNYETISNVILASPKIGAWSKQGLENAELLQSLSVDTANRVGETPFIVALFTVPLEHERGQVDFGTNIDDIRTLTKAVESLALALPKGLGSHNG